MWLNADLTPGPSTLAGTRPKRRGEQRTLTNLYNARPTLAGTGAQEAGRSHLRGVWLAERFVRRGDFGALAGVEFGAGGEGLNLMLENRIVKKTLYVLERVFIVELMQMMLPEVHGSYTENFPPNTLFRCNKRKIFSSYARKFHNMRNLFLP